MGAVRSCHREKIAVEHRYSQLRRHVEKSNDLFEVKVKTVVSAASERPCDGHI